MKSIPFLSLLVLFLASITPLFAEDSPFAKSWDTNWGLLVIEQGEDGAFTGKYSGKFTGTIEGKLKEDGKLHFNWKQPNGEHGKGVFTIDAEGNLKGTWGGNHSSTSGGSWDGKPAAE